MKSGLHIGMRKIKSLLAVILSFLIWQSIRIVFTKIEIHPIFAYIYAIIEMRENPEKTINFGKLRIKATLIGLVIGLIFVTISIMLSSKVNNVWIQTMIEFVLILLAVLIALSVGEIAGCKNFCGIAAIITVICMVSHSDEDRYLYAVMRVLQTLIGVFSAAVVNTFIHKKHEEIDGDNLNNESYTDKKEKI